MALDNVSCIFSAFGLATHLSFQKFPNSVWKSQLASNKLPQGGLKGVAHEAFENCSDEPFLVKNLEAGIAISFNRIFWPGSHFPCCSNSNCLCFVNVLDLGIFPYVFSAFGLATSQVAGPTWLWVMFRAFSQRLGSLLIYHFKYFQTAFGKAKLFQTSYR